MVLVVATKPEALFRIGTSARVSHWQTQRALTRTCIYRSFCTNFGIFPNLQKSFTWKGKWHFVCKRVNVCVCVAFFLYFVIGHNYNYRHQIRFLSSFVVFESIACVLNHLFAWNAFSATVKQLLWQFAFSWFDIVATSGSPVTLHIKTAQFVMIALDLVDTLGKLKRTNEEKPFLLTFLFGNGRLKTESDLALARRVFLWVCCLRQVCTNAHYGHCKTFLIAGRQSTRGEHFISLKWQKHQYWLMS